MSDSDSDSESRLSLPLDSVSSPVAGPSSGRPPRTPSPEPSEESDPTYDPLTPPRTPKKAGRHEKHAPWTPKKGPAKKHPGLVFPEVGMRSWIDEGAIGEDEWRASPSQGTKRRRVDYTEADQKVIFNHLYSVAGLEMETYSGNGIFKDIANLYPRHTWHSWREHWVRVLVPRLGPAMDEHLPTGSRAPRTDEGKLELARRIAADVLSAASRPEFPKAKMPRKPRAAPRSPRSPWTPSRAPRTPSRAPRTPIQTPRPARRAQATRAATPEAERPLYVAEIVRTPHGWLSRPVDPAEARTPVPQWRLRDGDDDSGALPSPPRTREYWTQSQPASASFPRDSYVRKILEEEEGVVDSAEEEE